MKLFPLKNPQKLPLSTIEYEGGRNAFYYPTYELRRKAKSIKHILENVQIDRIICFLEINFEKVSWNNSFIIVLF